MVFTDATGIGGDLEDATLCTLAITAWRAGYRRSLGYESYSKRPWMILLTVRLESLSNSAIGADTPTITGNDLSRLPRADPAALIRLTIGEVRRLFNVIGIDDQAI